MKKKLLLSSLASAVLALTAQAEVLVYEGFDYSSPADTIGENGGTGWSGAWTQTGGGSPDVVGGWQASSLSFTNDPFTPAGGAFLGRNSVGTAERLLSGATEINLGLDGDAVFFSYLLSAEAVSSNENQLSFYDDTTSVLDTGIRNDDFRLRSGASAQVTTGTPVNGTVYLVAGFIDPNSSSNDVFGLNVYTDGSSIPATISTAASGDWLLYDNGKSLSSVIDRVRFAANGANDSQETRFDEIRLGTTWASVTAVPETSSFGLIAGAFALAAMGLRRRR